MTSRAKLPPLPLKRAWCGHCPWTVALPKPAHMHALIEHAREHVGTVAPQQDSAAEWYAQTTNEAAPGGASTPNSRGLTPDKEGLATW